MENQNQNTNYSPQNQNIYEKFKTKQSQYIDLIKQLHQENHRLKQLLIQKERKIQYLTNNHISSPFHKKFSSQPQFQHLQSKHTIRQSPNHNPKQTKQNQQVKVSNISLFPPQPSNIRNCLNIQKKIFPSKNTNITFKKDNFQREENRYKQLIPTKEDQSIPTFKTDQIFKDMIKQCQDQQVIKTILDDQNKGQDMDFIKNQQQLQNGQQIIFLQTFAKDQSDSTFRFSSTTFNKYSYENLYSPIQTKSGQNQKYLPRQQTNKHRITNKIYL